MAVDDIQAQRAWASQKLVNAKCANYEQGRDKWDWFVDRIRFTDEFGGYDLLQRRSSLAGLENFESIQSLGGEFDEPPPSPSN